MKRILLTVITEADVCSASFWADRKLEFWAG
jgi:hypothetical protein